MTIKNYYHPTISIEQVIVSKNFFVRDDEMVVIIVSCNEEKGIVVQVEIDFVTDISILLEKIHVVIVYVKN